MFRQCSNGKSLTQEEKERRLDIVHESFVAVKKQAQLGSVCSLASHVTKTALSEAAGMQDQEFQSTQSFWREIPLIAESFYRNSLTHFNSLKATHVHNQKTCSIQSQTSQMPQIRKTANKNPFTSLIRRLFWNHTDGRVCDAKGSMTERVDSTNMHRTGKGKLQVLEDGYLCSIKCVFFVIHFTEYHIVFTVSRYCVMLGYKN